MPLYLSELLVCMIYFIDKIGQIVNYNQAKHFDRPSTTYGILECTNYYPSIGPQGPKIQKPSMPLYLSELLVCMIYFINKIGQIVYYTQDKHFGRPNFITPD